MQVHAEEAMKRHLSTNLQPAFNRELKTRSSVAPFSRDLTPDEVNSILNTAIRRSHRYNVLKSDGLSDKQIHVKPFFVTRIEDKNGNVLETFKPESGEAINENTAYVMLNALQNVVDKGSGHWLRSRYNFTSQIAGKTGTTQNNSDRWFMGIVPDLVTGIWVGAEDRSVHFENRSLGQGASMDLPIWAFYMQQVYKDENLNYSIDDEFEIPENLNIQLECKEKGGLGYPDPYGFP